MAEVVLDFFDRLKSVEPRLCLARLSASSASRPASLVRLDILINGDKVDALAVIVHGSPPIARSRGGEKMRS
jgi:GTP-binding protein LepA